MTENRIPHRQFQLTIAQMSEEEMFIRVFIGRLTDEAFARKCANELKISGKPPKFYKRAMNG